MYDFDETEFLATSLNTAVMNVYNCKQGSTESNANYLARFRNNLDVLEYYGGSFGVHESLIKKEMTLNNIASDPSTFHQGNDEYDEYAEKSFKRSAADLFLRNADAGRFKKLQLDIFNDFILRDVNPPKDIKIVFTLMNTYKDNTVNKLKGSEDKENEGNRFGKNNNKFNKNSRRGDESGGFKEAYESMNGHVFQMKDESRIALQLDIPREKVCN